MDTDTPSLNKPHARQRLVREGDGDDFRSIWHVLHEHDGKLSLIDKDLTEMKRAMSDISVQVAVLAKTVERIGEQFDGKLTKQFLEHEKREMEMQQKIMVRGLLLLVSAFGALAYFILNRVALATGAG